MNILNRKKLVASLFVAISVMVSVSANAEQVSLEQLLSHKVQAQGQKVLKTVSSQINLSVQNSLNAFSTEIKKQWVTGGNTKVALTSNKKAVHNLSSKSSTE